MGNNDMYELKPQLHGDSVAVRLAELDNGSRTSLYELRALEPTAIELESRQGESELSVDFR